MLRLKARSSKLMQTPLTRRAFLAVVITGGVLLMLGLWALNLQAQQARDTKRKLDLEDLESALLRALAQTGTVPPADRTTWCGVITAPANREIRNAIEQALRETKKYAKPEKPFPADPRLANTDRDYAYWKTSPVSFELLAHLEADDNNSRPLDLERCELVFDEGGPKVPRNFGEGGYDYAISSLQRVPL